MSTIETVHSHPEFDGLICREKNEPGRVDLPDTDTSDENTAENAKSLLCSRCRTGITDMRYAVEINGSHRHTFFNPAGIVYEISCFSKARGCAIYGKPTDEFTWFKGHTWQFAICSTCLVHLGWLFRESGNSFYGLIASKLVEE